MVAVVAEAVVTDMYCKMKNRILLQFHITGKCNLCCKHCYRTEGDVQPLGFEDIANVIEQYKNLQERYNTIHNIKRKGHINITGGEPFMREDIKEVLSLLGDNRELFSYGVLSNGSFIDENILRILKQTQASFVQLSIDGDRHTHDYLRADGDYDRVFAVAQKLDFGKQHRPDHRLRG